MRWINMLDAWLDTFDLTSAFQITVLTLILFKVYSLQIAEKLDELVERVPPKYGWFRRAASVGESVAWIWVLLYQYEGHVAPRPPGLFLALMCLCGTAARFVIVYKDFCRAKKLGREVASIADILPQVRTSARKGDIA